MGVITARVWLKGEVTKNTSTLEVAIAESFAPILIYFVGQPLVMYLSGEPDVLATLGDWALNCVVFISPLGAMVFDVAESKMQRVEDTLGDKLHLEGECCPVHSLLVILTDLHAKDAIEEKQESTYSDCDSDMEGSEGPSSR